MIRRVSMGNTPKSGIYSFLRFLSSYHTMDPVMDHDPKSALAYEPNV